MIAENAVPQSLVNHPAVDHLHQRLIALRERWLLLPGDDLRHLLRAAGCPTTPEEPGHDRARLKASYAQARQIRSRCTIFDLAAEVGCLTDCVEQLFAPGGFWIEG